MWPLHPKYHGGPLNHKVMAEPNPVMKREYPFKLCARQIYPHWSGLFSFARLAFVWKGDNGRIYTALRVVYRPAFLEERGNYWVTDAYGAQSTSTVTLASDNMEQS